MMKYIHITELYGEEVRFTFTQDLKKLSDFSRLNKYKKHSADVWGPVLFDILQKELKAEQYTVIFAGGKESYDVLFNTLKNAAILLINSEEFDAAGEQNMLEYLANEENPIAIDILNERNNKKEKQGEVNNDICDSEDIDTAEKEEKLEQLEDEEYPAADDSEQSEIDEKEIEDSSSSEKQYEGFIKSNGEPAKPDISQKSAENSLVESIKYVKKGGLNCIIDIISKSEIVSLSRKVKRIYPSVKTSKVFIMRSQAGEKEFSFVAAQLFYNDKDQLIRCRENNELLGRIFGGTSADSDVIQTIKNSPNHLAVITLKNI